jgi:hypothetical protein
MTIELKPCPFCGGKAHAMVADLAVRQPEFVMCLACLGEIEGPGAIEKWNTRKEPASDLSVALAKVEELQALSVTNIMLAVVPGDGDGYEVYAESVADVVDTLGKMYDRIEELEGEVSSLNAESFESLYNDVCEQRDQLVELLRDARRALDPFHSDVCELQSRIDAALSGIAD